MLKSKLWKPVFLSLFFSILCYIGFLFFNPLYISSDNIGVAVVTNGFYGKNNFCQYLHPLLCLVIKALRRVLPAADLFTMLIHIVFIFCIGLLFYLFTADIVMKPVREIRIVDVVRVLMTVMAILLFSSGIIVWNANYTIQTGAIMFAGLLILFLSAQQRVNRVNGESALTADKNVNKNKSVKNSVPIPEKPGLMAAAGTLITVFGFMLRVESALLFLPFVFLEVLVRIMEPLLTGSGDRAEPVKGTGSGESCELSFSHKIKLEMNSWGTEKDSRSAPGGSKAASLSPVRKNTLHTGNTLLPVIPCAMIAVLLLISRAAFFSQEPYQTAVRYNEARTAAVDFPMKGWTRDVEEAAGGVFSQADYQAVTNWCFFDTEYMDADLLEAVVDAGSRNNYGFSEAGLKAMLQTMKRTLFHSSLYMVILIALSAVLAVRSLVYCRWWRKLETAAALAGAFVIIAYFTMRGRAPMRVWEPVIFAVDFVLLMCSANCPDAFTHRSPQKNKGILKADPVFAGLLFAILWFSTGQLLAYAEFHSPQPVWLSGLPAEQGKGAYDRTISDAAGEDALFLWSNWHAYIPVESMLTGRLPSREVLRHNIPLGDWVYGQPYFTELLESVHAVNPAKALLERQNTWVAGGSQQLVEEYLCEHYGSDIRLEPAPGIGEINGVTVYRAVHGKGKPQENSVTAH